jgi:uncharacterized protein
MPLKTPALVAIAKKYAKHPEFLGIDIDDINQPGAVDDTLLHIVARTGAIDDLKTLIAEGASVNPIGDLGNTPLHQAAMNGQITTAEYLLLKLANPRIRNEFDETAFDVATQGGHKELAALIKKYLR